jgi:hypothetical protein
MPRNPSGKASMVSSQKVADEALPWTKSTGTPSSGPLKSACIVRRGVVISRALMPGSVGILLMGGCSLSRQSQ